MTIEPPFLGQTFPISWLSDPRQDSRALGDRHPPVLYHYANEAALRGIVSPQSWDIETPALARAAQFWATDVRYMMDSKELLFGATQLVSRLRKAAADSFVPAGLGDQMSRLADVFSDGDVLNWNLRCFAACFCEVASAVSNWQYFAGTGGYAIGFSWDILAEHSFALHPRATAIGTTPASAGLRRMTYGIPAANALADSIVVSLHRAYDQQDSLVGAMLRGDGAGLLSVAALLLQELATVKHGDFQHEREWRVIALSEPGYSSKIRESKSDDIPYLDVAVNMNQTNVLPTIARLVVGPGTDQQSRIALARELLEESGHSSDVVVGYDGPYRG